MIRIDDVILSEDIATAQFACNISRCKGACCVVGDAGAPVDKNEIPILRKAFNKLKHKLSLEAVEIAEEDGVILGNSEEGYEINCIDSGECIFVEKKEGNIATCAIQNAYYSNEFNWEKPVSCHLYPVRLKRIAGMDYANYEYIPELCSAGCRRGEDEEIYLADFLETALVRRYGQVWYDEFCERCNEVRNRD